jgi:hypothetical protein
MVSSALEEKNSVIRQAISCDICGTEMQGTNHWFVAYDHGGELRISGWTSRNRLRAGARHLCGHTCLHKLVDDFMARTLAMRTHSAAADLKDEPQKQQKTPRRASAHIDTSLTALSAPSIGDSLAPCVDEFESSARIIAQSEPVPPALVTTRAIARLQVVAPQPTAGVDDALIPDMPSYSSRVWRAEAWKREREREEHAAHHPSPSTRRRSNA